MLRVGWECLCVFDGVPTQTIQLPANIELLSTPLHRELGEALAKGGHLCINGGGKVGVCLGVVSNRCVCVCDVSLTNHFVHP